MCLSILAFRLVHSFCTAQKTKAVIFGSGDHVLLSELIWGKSELVPRMLGVLGSLSHIPLSLLFGFNF